MIHQAGTYEERTGRESDPDRFESEFPRGVAKIRRERAVELPTGDLGSHTITREEYLRRCAA